MARLSKRETLERQTLYEISYEYIRKNFHKFNDRNKIKVAISMLQIFDKEGQKATQGDARPIQIVFVDKRAQEQKEGIADCRFVSSPQSLNQ